jgi:Lon-like ATP-dependent protease
VGGVLRKLQAAARTGCRRVFVPAENLRRLDRQELAALPLEVVPVVHVEEVIPAVFAAESQALTA